MDNTVVFNYATESEPGHDSYIRGTSPAFTNILGNWTICFHTSEFLELYHFQVEISVNRPF